MANASVVAELILRARDRTAQAFDSLQRRLNDVDRQTRRVNAVQRQFNAVDAAVGRAGAAVAGFAAVGAGVGFAKIVGATMDFESALVGVQKKAGLTAEQTAKLGEEVKDLATSGELAVPISEILAGYERAGAAGIPLDEMKEFVKLTAMASDAFEMSAEDSANAFLGFNKTLGLGFNSMERYADLINSLADAGIADESGIVNFIDRAGPSLKTFGMTLEQMAALGATAGNIKMGDDVAANTLSTLTGKLLAPGSPKARAALAEIVGNVDEFQDLLKTDANKAFEEFLGHVRELDKFKGAELLTAFVGEGYNDEIQRFAAAYDEVISNRKLAESDAWYGSLTKAYQLKLGTLEAQWEITKNAIEELSIDVGNMGLPAMKSGLEAARGVIGDIGEELKSFEAKIKTDELTAAQGAVGDLATAIGELLGIEGEGAPIKTFFAGLAKTVDTTAQGINTIRDGLEHFGLVEDDAETLETENKRHDEVRQNLRDLSPPLDYLLQPGLVDRHVETMIEGAGKIGGLIGIGEDDASAEPTGKGRLRSPEEVSVWGAPSQDDLRDIGNRFSDQGGSGWSGGGFEEGRGVTSGPPGFTPGRGVSVGGPMMGEADELRRTMVDGGATISRSGEEAGAALRTGGTTAAAEIAAAAAALERAAAAIGANGRAAAAAISGAKVNVTLPGGGQLATGNRGRTMPDAGIPGGGSLSGRNTGRSMPYAGSPASGAEGARR